MGIFTSIFHEHSEKAKELDEKLNNLKKILEKIMGEVVDLDEDFWGLESSIPQSNNNAKIIPKLHSHYGKLKKLFLEVSASEKEVKSLLSLYENEMKMKNPSGFLVAKHLLEDFFFSTDMTNSAIKSEMQDVLAAMELFKESGMSAKESTERLHEIIDDYERKEKDLQHYTKNIYHKLVKLEIWSKRYLKGPVEETIPR